jgi:hypothetical protein
MVDGDAVAQYSYAFQVYLDELPCAEKPAA